AVEPGSRRTRDQDALHDRLQPQVELDRRAFGDAEDLDAQICWGLNRSRHLALGPRAATELASIEHERRSRVQLAQWFTFGSGHGRSPRIVSGQVRPAKLPGCPPALTRHLCTPYDADPALVHAVRR